MITQNNCLDTMVYNVGLYLRLSREDEENGQSMSCLLYTSPSPRD